MKIVLFNGPPYSGKDTAARMLAEHLDKITNIPVKEESLSLPLRWIAYAMVGRVYVDEVQSDYAGFKKEYFRLLNRTGRQLMIDASERFLKKCYGSGVMSDLLLERNETFTGLLLIRDSGFQCEVNPLIDVVGRENVYLVHIQREACNFDNDSREWVRHDGDKTMGLLNNGSLDDLRTEVIRIYGRLVNQMAWRL